MRAVLLCAIGVVAAGGFHSPASAQVQYGPWRKTTDCQTARAPSGVGRSAIQLPSIGAPATACVWEREVRDCPRVRDKLAHPIQCSTRKQRSSYTTIPPRD